MTSILALWVCPASGQQCQPMIGEQMQFAECLMTGQTKAADFVNRNPVYQLRKYSCVEPRRVQAILGRTMARLLPDAGRRSLPADSASHSRHADDHVCT
jgi:hypothetical protein